MTTGGRQLAALKAEATVRVNGIGTRNPRDLTVYFSFRDLILFCIGTTIAHR